MDDLVTLEAYADENRALMHSGRTDEVIAICKHILHYYPKHIDSYRQLGEAYLEKDELDPAMDMFRRVLSADPENVVAYVGLAAVFEKQHLTDEAVWHLERADEIAPGNFEIHKELLRLYSDAGKPRQRLKLTPNALARLYDQEGLYSQAIQELRGLVDASPARFDARVALAETLWHAGRIRESAEAAQSLLNSLPYCLKANLILGTAWKESSVADHETYLNRALELDPSNKVAHRLLGARSPLAAAPVYIPRYIEGVPPLPMPQSIPESLTALSSEPARVPAALPGDQLAGLFGETPMSEAGDAGSLPIESEGGPIPRPDLPGANLPPWLVSQFPESDKAEPAIRAESPAEDSLSEPDTGAPQLSEDELPAWLKRQPSTEDSERATAESSQGELGKLPAWLENSTDTEPIPAVEEQLQAGQSAPSEPAGPIEDYTASGLIAPAMDEAKPTEEQIPADEPPTINRAAEKQPEETPFAPPIVVEMPAAAESVAVTPKRKRQPKGYPHLVLAREHRDAGRTNDALAEYDYLVLHAPRLVNDVIQDLEGLTAGADAPLEAHRILGDAYTRADRLAEALQRYQYVLERTAEPSTQKAPGSNL